MDTIPTDIAHLRVHIAPVGYEVDRIVMPARRMRADRVILLVHENPSQDKAVGFYEQITKQLRRHKIEVRTEHHDRRDLFRIIRAVRDLIGKEEGNFVSVNLASGSKIQAIGCMMACMMFNDGHNVSPFYVEAGRYLGFSGKPISEGIGSIDAIPTYEIRRPGDRLVSALRIIRENGDRISKKDMARAALDEKLITVNAENQSQATFSSLDKNIISPLENHWKFIRVEKVGRTRWIQATDEGKNASEFLI